MSKKVVYILLIIFLFAAVQTKASHIVGGEVTYKFLGANDSGNHYRVSLVIYEDCQNGQPSAIQADNPANLAVYDNPFPIGRLINIDSNVFYDSSVLVPTNFANLCVTNPPVVCLLKKTFIKDYYFAPNSTGYWVVYQRCCRNSAIVNVQDPGNSGSTYFCHIPSSGVVSNNNSAVFKNYPPLIICINNPLIYDNSATDADGDSLSYGFCAAYKGASNVDIKPPVPAPPPFDSVDYINPPYTSLHPISGVPTIVIDPVTGIVTGTPNKLGRYLVTVFCNEWRHGVLINTQRREFQFVVTNCSKSVIADIPQLSNSTNTYIVDCADFTVNFENTSIGGKTWHWNFGVPANNSDTSNLITPTYTYPDTGTYIVSLKVNPHSTCSDSIWRYVKIYPKFKADFYDTGSQCPGLPISFIDNSSSSIKPVTYWYWDFGDGQNSSLQYPVHTYYYGGTYNVTLVSQNIKNCIDTSVKQVLVETFKPFAGNDTVIVKGENILFNATGGISYYWTPSENLNFPNIYDPIGSYPDTGTYTYEVHVISPYGCSGDDTIKVQVVNQAAFFVPTGFSPNGDGRNDFFRPRAIGYRSLTYFKIFNRWGQMVYITENFESGWDGKFDGQHCEVGTYFWEISYTDRFGKNGTLKGDVTLIR